MGTVTTRISAYSRKSIVNMSSTMMSSKAQASVARSSFAGARVGAKAAPIAVSNGSKVVMKSRSQVGRWRGLDAGQDQSDDQQDITRGRNMTESLFQGAQGLGGTHNSVLTSSDYLST